jgi:preprotein translocase subunit SecF
MELFNPSSNVDFMGIRKYTAVFSVLIVILSMFALYTNGLRFGLDFTGGMQLQLAYKVAPDLENLRQKLADAGFVEAQVVNYGSSKDILLSLKITKDDKQKDIGDKIAAICPEAEFKQIEYVGPQVGKELASQGVMAVIISLLVTMVYIAMRFEYRLAISAAIALIHDPILILGIFAFFGIEFDLKSLAGLLAVIGYSLNDTIVVFDRVRENFLRLRRSSAVEIMNISINQTLSRTIMTSLLTLCVVLALLFYGGTTIRGFSLALVIGIIIGTYSSIYVAGALAVVMGLDKKDFIKKKSKNLDDRP